MAKINLAGLSMKELVALQNELPALIAERAKVERNEVRAKLAALAAESGFDLNELLGSSKGRRGPKGSGTVAIKYRNPDNPSETWSGRGRMATWLKDKLSKRGAKIEDFAV